MRNRRFAPCVESMEFRFTPSGGGAAAVVASSSTDCNSDTDSGSGGIDFTGQTGVNVAVFSSSTTVPDAFSPGSDDDGIDFTGQTGVYIPVFS